MPDNATEFLWWAVNGLILVGVWFAQNKLGNIEKLLEKLFEKHDNHEARITRLEVRCNMQHGEPEPHPMRRTTDYNALKEGD